jgi:hypothetical protein
VRCCVLLHGRHADERIPGCQVRISAGLRANLTKEGDHAEWMHDNGAGDSHITPYITDFDSWTSDEVTQLGGIGGGALMSYGTGTVNMLTLDAHGNPYCYTMHDVKYAPRAGIRLMAAESRSARQGCTRRLKHSHRNDLTARIYRSKYGTRTTGRRALSFIALATRYFHRLSACDPALRKVVLSRKHDLHSRRAVPAAMLGRRSFPNRQEKGGARAAKHVHHLKKEGAPALPRHRQ